jgi:hypothetical protein
LLFPINSLMSDTSRIIDLVVQYVLFMQLDLERCEVSHIKHSKIMYPIWNPLHEI